MVGELSIKDIQQVLKKNLMGRIGCTDGKRVYVVPVNYFYEGRSILCHSFEGHKIKIMQKNPSVCFEVDEVPHPSQWKSVIVYGRYEEITDEKERFSALNQYLNHLSDRSRHQRAVAAGAAMRLATPTVSGVRTIVYRIFIEEMTGRFESHNHLHPNDE